MLRPRRKLHSPAGCGQYLPLRLQLLENRSQRRLLQHSIQRYHYLGYRVPYGAQLRYFVRSRQPPYPLLACLLFTSAAWKMAPLIRCKPFCGKPSWMKAAITAAVIAPPTGCRSF
ncbi:MAG: hypothetical protein DMG70_04280 [Acidobacteria bacterium]|nr:MAG: hypothetical protein DMG70_04280 [Acidobacteriota bacterium]PYY04690.1 MAG: hypothetical protein DMG69_29445 [Acidobacteriota bacterium]